MVPRLVGHPRLPPQTGRAGNVWLRRRPPGWCGQEVVEGGLAPLSFRLVYPPTYGRDYLPEDPPKRARVP